MKTLVIGLGNPILGDDGVGWVVAEQVREILDNCTPPKEDGRDLEFDFLSLGGLSLMERLTDSEQVVLIDSIYTGQRPIGSVWQFDLDSLPDMNAGHSASAHDTSLKNALKVGREMDVHLPEDKNVHIVAIEAKSVYDFSEELTPSVAAAVPQAVHMVLDLLDHPEK